MARVLFVCIENSNRSQMAEAFARMLGEDVLEPYSAGSRPSGAVNPRAVTAMAELGYDLSQHRSKGLDEVPDGPYDYVVTMGCGDACPWIEADVREDWALPDPRSMPPEEFNRVRDEIELRVRRLIERVRAREATDAADGG
ncbi:MAG: arsenate reductase ArsC [Gemmatimonadetes bacterium]|nr:MAG: arsenate reductase ArsC [Gemmatimonadota bacterium]